MDYKSPSNAIILGAGPAGLTLGYKLAEAGVKVEIFEKSDRVGGLCATNEYKGFRFDLGGHRFVTKDKLVKGFIEKLMGEDILVRPRKSVIILKGKTLDYPVNAKDVLQKLGLFFSVNAFSDYFLTAALQKMYPRADSSFEQWVVNRFGTTLYNLYFGPYSAKLWGTPPNTISAKWADQRITLLNLWDVLQRLIFKKSDVPLTYADHFYYPPQGIGQISEKLASYIIKKGGRIHLKSKIERIITGADVIKKLSVSDFRGKSEEFHAEIFINTIPLPDFIRLTSPGEDNLVMNFVNAANYRSLRFLNVCLDLPQVTDNTWIYIPEVKYIFFRIQEMRNWSPTMVPKNKCALTLEIACNYMDKLWTMSDKELWNICLQDLLKLNLIKKDCSLGYFSTYAKHAYPVYTLNYNETVEGMYTYIRKFKNLRSIGRQGLFRYNNMDHSIKMGLLTADHLLKGYPFTKVLDIATEGRIFDWQDPSDK